MTPKDDPKSVAKVDKSTIKGRQKGRQKDDHCVDLKLIKKKGQQKTAFIFVYSLIQKRERVAHYLSVFIIVIIYFDKN